MAVECRHGWNQIAWLCVIWFRSRFLKLLSYITCVLVHLFFTYICCYPLSDERIWCGLGQGLVNGRSGWGRGVLAIMPYFLKVLLMISSRVFFERYFNINILFAKNYKGSRQGGKLKKGEVNKNINFFSVLLSVSFIDWQRLLIFFDLYVGISAITNVNSSRVPFFFFLPDWICSYLIFEIEDNFEIKLYCNIPEESHSLFYWWWEVN